MSAKLNLLVVVAIPAIATMPLLACGSDSKSPDAASGGIDGSGSGSGSGSNNACAFPSSLGTIASFTAQSVRYRSGSGFGSGGGSGSGGGTPRANRLTFTGALDGSGTEEVQITIYGGCGSTGSGCSGSVPLTPDWPTTFGAKSGLDLAQAVDVSAITGAGVGSNGRASTTYAATGGTLDVTAAGNGSGAPFAGDVSNATFVHVDIGSAGVTADPDGCTTTITSMTFSGSAAFAGKALVDDLDPDDMAVTYLHHRYF